MLFVFLAIASSFVLSRTSVVSSFAGTGAAGFSDGQFSTAIFNYPFGIAVDASDNVIIADSYNNKIRKLSNNGFVSTIAGNGSNGDADGQGQFATFGIPSGLAINSVGDIIVGDYTFDKIRKITANGAVSTLAGSGTGYVDGPAASSKFNSAMGMVVDSSGNIIICDRDNNKVRMLSQSGIVSTIAGNSTGYRNGQGTEALFSSPTGIIIDHSGNIVIADTNNHRIRKITANGSVSTIAGNGVAGYSEGQAMNSSFNSPSGIAIDPNGNLIIADSGNNMIRLLSTDGSVSTIAGNGSTGLANGKDMATMFNNPTGVAIDSAGNIFVVDTGNNMIRKIVTVTITTTIMMTSSVAATKTINNITPTNSVLNSTRNSDLNNIKPEISTTNFTMTATNSINSEGAVGNVDVNNNVPANNDPSGISFSNSSIIAIITVSTSVVVLILLVSILFVARRKKKGALAQEIERVP